LAQGLVALDSELDFYGVANGVAGNYYNGPYGLEVWASSSSSNPQIAAIDSAGNLDAYAMLAADGFRLEATFSGLTMSLGNIEAGALTLWDAPGGSTITMCLAVWASDDASWAAAVAKGVNTGVLAFWQPTAIFDVSLPFTPDALQWGYTDLVMTPPSEPPRPQLAYTTNNGAITITKYTGFAASLTIPSTINGLPVTSIGDDAFIYWIGLTNLTIPNSVTNIGNNVFTYCTSLTNVTLPNSVTSIGSNAFAYCTSLTSISLPDSLTSIGESAFSGSTGLTNITIGNGVTNIGVWAFFGCTGLTGVFFRGDTPSVGDYAFQFDYNASFYYLPGTTGWLGWSYSGQPTLLWKPQVRSNDASFGFRANQFGFNINWASGMIVVVEASTNLANPVWSPLATNTLASGSAYFSDPQWTNYPGRFYRLRWP
jgi:hypothetical protein